jgi:hypothetical protein
LGTSRPGTSRRGYEVTGYLAGPTCVSVAGIDDLSSAVGSALVSYAEGCGRRTLIWPHALLSYIVCMYDGSLRA